MRSFTGNPCGCAACRKSDRAERDSAKSKNVDKVMLEIIKAFWKKQEKK